MSTRSDARMWDVFALFLINVHAWHYFGVLCFEDMPGYFPQLACRIRSDGAAA